MAIDAYVGLPGHGKSYGVTEHVIIPSIKEGRHVVTNVPLERDELLADFGIEGSDVSQLPEDWHERPDISDLIPHGCVLVLDELWRRWPAGLKANQAQLTDKSLLAEHRHRVDAKGRSMRVVLVTQDLSQLAAWVRILIEQTYKMTKLTAIGSNKKFRVDIYRGAPTGQNIPKNHLIRQTYGSYKPEVYKYYQSATQSATGMVGDESKADGRGNIFKSGFMIFAIAAPLLLTPFLVWYVYGIFFGTGIVDVPESDTHFETLANPPPLDMYVQGNAVTIPAGPPPPPPVRYSIEWRIAGYMLSGDGSPEDIKDTDYVVLKSAFASELRYMPVTACHVLPDRINWQCDVDGAVTTAWTGKGGYSDSFSSSGNLISGTASAASGATSGASPPTINPSPQQTY